MKGVIVKKMNRTKLYLMNKYYFCGRKNQKNQNNTQ